LPAELAVVRAPEAGYTGQTETDVSPWSAQPNRAWGCADLGGVSPLLIVSTRRYPPGALSSLMLHLWSPWRLCRSAMTR